MVIKTSDGGRSEAGINERLDCTVRATAIALGLSYAEAHGKLAALGRRTGHRFKYPRAVDALGLVQRPDLSCKTVSTALRDMAAGRFVVRISRHVFAVVDGVIHDTQADYPKATARVKMVYQVPTI